MYRKFCSYALVFFCAAPWVPFQKLYIHLCTFISLTFVYAGARYSVCSKRAKTSVLEYIKIIRLGITPLLFLRTYSAIYNLMRQFKRSEFHPTLSKPQYSCNSSLIRISFIILPITIRWFCIHVVISIHLFAEFGSAATSRSTESIKATRSILYVVKKGSTYLLNANKRYYRYGS